MVQVYFFQFQHLQLNRDDSGTEEGLLATRNDPCA